MNRQAAALVLPWFLWWMLVVFNLLGCYKQSPCKQETCEWLSWDFQVPNQRKDCPSQIRVGLLDCILIEKTIHPVEEKKKLLFWVFCTYWLSKFWCLVHVMALLFWAHELGSLTTGLTLGECYLLSDFSSLVGLRCFGNPFPSFLFISPFTTCSVRLFGTLASLRYFLAETLLFG